MNPWEWKNAVNAPQAALPEHRNFAGLQYLAGGGLGGPFPGPVTQIQSDALFKQLELEKIKERRLAAQRAYNMMQLGGRSVPVAKPYPKCSERKPTLREELQAEINTWLAPTFDRAG